MISTFFAAIHEFAVLGTTFFILALATLWYSPLLFGNVWLRVSKTAGVVFDETEAGFWKQIGVAFVVYLGQVALVAFALTFSHTLHISPFVLPAGAAVVLLLATIPPVLFEARPWQYYAIHTGFMVVVLAVTTALLEYWPW